MKRAVFLAAFVIPFWVLSQDLENKLNPNRLPISRLEIERGKVNYDLNEIIKFIEDSVHLKFKVVTPPNANAFESVLFSARRYQHLDSQSVAIHMLQNLLEFKYYRNRAEELYIKLLLANSLRYIGAERLAYDRMQEVFPELLDYIEDDHTKGFFLNHYAAVYNRIDSIEKAVDVYRQVYRIALKAKDDRLLYNTQNNLGFTHYLLHHLDSAAFYLRKNQDPRIKEINPIIHAFSFGNYASILVELEEYDSALFYGRKEAKLLKEVPTEEGLDNLYQMMARIYSKKQAYDSSIYYFLLSNEISIKRKNIKNLAENYEALLKLALLNKNIPKAEEYLEKYILFKDSLELEIISKETDDELRTTEFFSIFSNAAQNRENYEILKRKSNQLYVLALALLGLIVVLVLWIVYRISVQKKLKQAYEKLKKNHQDLLRSNLLLQELIEKNELLFKELHHRVKNNLQIVSSLFRLQTHETGLSEESKEVFKLAENRIHSISLLHKKIYKSDTSNCLDFSSYLKEFSNEIVQNSSRKVNIDLDLPPIEMNIDTALPLGLIFNELFTNSIKHAVVDEQLLISIEYKLDREEEFLYQDNGIAQMDGHNDSRDQESFGRELISLLAKQLEAKINYYTASEKEPKSFRFSIRGTFRSK